MGISRKDALEDIRSLIPRIEEHLRKLRDEPFADAYNHWRDELRGWIAKIERQSRHVGRRTQSEVLRHVAQWKQAAGMEDEQGAGAED
jgi:hypothetical protein